MKTVHKYNLGLADRVHKSARPGPIRLVGLDPSGALCVWIEVDTDTELTTRTFVIVGTGHEVPGGLALEFAGSVVQGSFVWHIYEDWSGK